MLYKRIIPCLLVLEDGLVKTKKFSSPSYLGDPINVIRIFNDKEVDEIIVLDINKSKSNQIPNFDLIEQFASECFMPLCYGGGINNMQIVDKLFSIGVEKISIQTAAFETPQIINEITKKYGNQSLVISIDIKKNILGKNKIYLSSKKKYINKEISEVISEFVSLGAGEIMINSIDRDGCMNGLDLQLIESIKNSISVPLIVIGGVGKLKDISDGFKSGASAVACGSFFVYHGPHKAVLITYPNQEEINKI